MVLTKIAISIKYLSNKTKEQLWSLNAAQLVGNVNKNRVVDKEPEAQEFRHYNPKLTPGWGPQG